MLEIENLTIQFQTRRGQLTAVDRISFSLAAGETLGIVGESGSGKSVSSLAIMRILAKNSLVASGTIRFQGQNLLELSERQMRKIRGGEIAMIFQDPMTSLNPCYSIGFQLGETLRLHQGLSKQECLEPMLRLLEEVGIPDPKTRLANFPHQLSGGMSQRIMIAMAIACSPKLLIADEPTTALDVTIQAQILELLNSLRKTRKMGLILISHDMGVVAENADRILVMYAGQIVETGPRDQIISSPKHPYTRALLKTVPGQQGAFRSRLPALKGLVPDLVHRPTGCQFHPRCDIKESICSQEEPRERAIGSCRVKCIKPL